MEEFARYCKESLTNFIFRLPSRRLRRGFAAHVLKWPMGSDVWIGRRLTVQNVRGIRIGCRVVINPGVHIDLRGGVIIGDDVAIAAGTMIITADHDPDSPTRAYRTRPVSVGNRVWLATNVSVLPGTVIEDGGVLAAGSVAHGTVEENGIYAGNPARLIRHRSEGAQVRLDASLPFFS